MCSFRDFQVMGWWGPTSSLCCLLVMLQCHMVYNMSCFLLTESSVVVIWIPWELGYLPLYEGLGWDTSLVPPSSCLRSIHYVHPSFPPSPNMYITSGHISYYHHCHAMSDKILPAFIWHRSWDSWREEGTLNLGTQLNGFERRHRFAWNGNALGPSSATLAHVKYHLTTLVISPLEITSKTIGFKGYRTGLQGLTSECCWASSTAYEFTGALHTLQIGAENGLIASVDRIKLYSIPDSAQPQFL